MKRLAFCFCLLFSISINAQIKPSKVSLHDMTMQAANPAEAVLMLVNTEASRIEEPFGTVVSDRFVRFKVLRSERLSESDVLVPLYQLNSQSGKLIGLRVNVYTLVENKIVKTKIPMKNILKEKIILPIIHEGSVVEYAYTIDSQYITAQQLQRSLDPVSDLDKLDRRKRYAYFAPRRNGYMGLWSNQQTGPRMEVFRR